MAVNPNIILGIRPPEIQQRDPLETYGKILGLKNVMAQGESNDLQMRKLRQESEDDTAVRDAYRQSGGDVGKIRELLSGGGQYRALRELEKSDLERRGKEATIGKDTAAAAKSNNELNMQRIGSFASMLTNAKDQPSYESVLRYAGMQFGPEFLRGIPGEYNPQMVKHMVDSGMTIVQKMQDERKRQEIAQTASTALFNPGPNGQPVPNKAAQDFALQKASAGAARNNISINTEKNFLSNIGDVLGKDIGNAVSNAKGAVSTINTVNQIRDALDSGKVIAGPGTTARQFLGQVGQVMGVSGKDATEQLTNTRMAVQGLAQLELDAAQQMKGQGQITEAERSIIRRAASGDIDSMTVPELRSLTNVLDRSARQKIKTNTANVERLRGNPNAASMVEFMNVQEPPAYQQPQPGAGQAFNSLPDPARFDGKVMTDTSTGTRYKSSGGKWVRM